MVLIGVDRMAHMKREDRALDVACFMHRNYLVNGQWITVGEYARFANVSPSPHLRGLFAEMLDAGILTMQAEPYKATTKYTFALNYEHIEEGWFQSLKLAITKKVGRWQEKLR